MPTIAPKPIYKLGKLASRHDRRTLPYDRYSTILPNVPAEVSWMVKVRGWPMYGNDVLGDCTIAAVGHQIEQWSLYAGAPFLPTEASILSAYEAVGGYVPGDPTTDNGCVILDVLNYWRKTGIAGHKILAYVKLDTTNLDAIREAIYLFGNVYMGVQLPLSAQGAGDWTVPPGGDETNFGTPGSWGGHAIPIVAMSPETLTVVTWGMTLKMSHNFFRDYCDEAYAVLSQDWIDARGLAPSQFDLAQLQADLLAVTGGV